MDATGIDFEAILACFARHEVEFIVVGGVAAALQGAPVTTFDLDLLYHHTEANLDRLLLALKELDARYRGRPGPPLVPVGAHFTGRGQVLLATAAGPLDLLAVVGEGETFATLIAETERVRLGDDAFRILALPALIRLKETLGREKDRAALPLLRRVLREREGEGGAESDGDA